MTERIDYKKNVPSVLRAMVALQQAVENCGLEHALMELVKVRASQINGCASCLDVHTKDARAGGETEQRLYGLNAWREAPYYSERERAALAWTEAVTLVHRDHVPDAVYQQAREHFNDKELADLTLCVVAINGWNRLAIAFRSPAGAHQARNRG